MYQDLYDRRKKIVKMDACMKFYNAARLPWLATDVSGVGLGARLVKVRYAMNNRHDKVPDNTTLNLIAFTSKTLSRAEWSYGNIE